MKRSRKRRKAFVAHKLPEKDKACTEAATEAAAEAVARPCAESKRKPFYRRARMMIIIEKMLGVQRNFAGEVTIPEYDIARTEDYLRVEDIRGDLITGQAAVYWVDGSEQSGFLGAGVVRYEDGSLTPTSYKLGPAFRGCCNDAELFAIAVALELAKCSVQDGQDLRLLRIFSDSQGVLMGLQTGKIRWIGPLHHEIIAIQRVFEVTDWLVAKGVEVELVWVKGHKASDGNKMADRAASKAIERQLLVEKKEPTEEPDQLDVPEKWRQLGKYWVAEWEHRVGCKDQSV